MKKTAKWIVAALAAALVLLVMGCNNGSDSVAVESVTVSDSSLKLGVGDTVLLRATVDPLNAEGWTLTWESSNDDVVTVGEYGKVAAVSVGTATITAKAGGKQGTCEVTVHVHSYSEGKCTVCEAKLKIEGCVIGDGGVLTSYNGKDTAVVIPETVTGIGKGAFKYNKDIESVTIPGSVKSIESADDQYSGAFYGCTKLAEVTMSDGVESIGSYAFNGCTSLASVEIPASVTSIGEDAFNGCTNLMEIQFEGSKEQWSAIEGSDKVGILGIRCSDGHIGILGVPAYLIVSGTEVTRCKYDAPANIVIPEGITGIKQGAFWYKDIESVTIAGSVKNIGSEAFKSCTKLTTVKMDKGVTSIGSSAFQSCTSLASMTIPDSVTSIGSSAFSGCTSLASVTIPASVTSIGSGAFYGTSLASVTYKGTLAQWCAMDNDYDLMSNAKTVTLDGMPNLKAVTKLTIPEGVESIGNSAFYYCTNLTEVEIPNTVKSIGYSAFCWCTSLASVTYKGTLAQWCAMGNDYDLMSNAKTVTLDDMSNLKAVTKLTIPEGVESIGKYAFCYCTNFTEVEIPNTVKSIESSAFWGCTSLTTVTIPASVTSIGSGAFYGCKSLSGVQYGGTQEEWKKINRAKSDYSSAYDDYLTGKKITGADGKPWIAE